MCLFLLVFYRVLGAIAVGGLIIYGIYFFALIKLIPITLTLPGIAGLILTIGVAADANIVIFERVKEEIRSGRSVISGIATGYKRGFAAIVDANVVTFMTAFILFALATAEVKGFAFTLGIGTLVSLFTAVLATQAALGVMGRSRLVTHPAALGVHKERKGWTFDFMGASKWFFSLSGTILLIGALAIGGKGLNFGIDFKSGTRIQTRLRAERHDEPGRRSAERRGLPNAEVQKITNASVGGTGFQISTKKLAPTGVKKVEAALNKKFGIRSSPSRTPDFSSTSIGPTFGKTVANSAVIAIIASLLVISAYIALRFEWKYAVPVLIALMHDLLITAGVYSLTGREVTTATVAALLTILGYSLYDTIIVFDRVRENVPRMPRAAFSQIVNRSMSEVLTRSLATSFCTLLPVIALLLFGGETLKDFAFALMIGIASGAYSSIFIASPVLTHWKEREPAYRARRARIDARTGSVPAYATTAAGAPDDVEPQRKRRRTRRGSLIAPEEPGQQISRDEFQELVRDLDVDGERGRAAERHARRHRGPAADAPADTAEAPPERDPAADLTPEDLVLKDEPKPRPRSAGRATAATGGRADGDARLGDDGPCDLALHDLPARPLLGRDRRRLRRLADRRDPRRADHLRRESLGARDPRRKGDRHRGRAVRGARRADRDRAGLPGGHAPRTGRASAPRALLARCSPRGARLAAGRAPGDSVPSTRAVVSPACSACRFEIPPCPPAAVLALRASWASAARWRRCSCAGGIAEPGQRASVPGGRRGASPAGLRAASARPSRRSSATCARGRRITVHGDYDVDGICSTAVLVRALRGWAPTSTPTCPTAPATATG